MSNNDKNSKIDILTTIWQLIALACGVYGAYTLPERIASLLGFEISFFSIIPMTLYVLVASLVIYFVPHDKIEQRQREHYKNGFQAGYEQAQRETCSVERELQSEREELNAIQLELAQRSSDLDNLHYVLEQKQKDFENELKKKAAPLARKKSSDYVISLVKAASANKHFSGSQVFRAISDTSNKDILTRFETAQTKTIHFADSISVFTRMYGSKGEVYEVSLDNCTCPDFTRRGVGACKHMLKLALELSLLSADDNELPKTK